MENQAIALGKAHERGIQDELVKPLLESSWCKSSPAKAVAGRPVASVAIRRVTGGCEAYTARKQAVRIQLRNRLSLRIADAVSLAEGSIRTADRRGGLEVAGVPSPGHAFTETPCEPRRSRHLSRDMGPVVPNPKRTWCLQREGSLRRQANRPSTRSSGHQGRPEVAAMGGEKSYDPIVPEKGENRRAPARGGHDIHWREGANR